MERRAAYVREAGADVPIVCIHASASSSGQWRPLMDRLAGGFLLTGSVTPKPSRGHIAQRRT